MANEKLSRNVFAMVLYNFMDGAAFSVWQNQVFQVLLYQLADNSNATVGIVSGIAGAAQVLAALTGGFSGDTLPKHFVTRAAVVVGLVAATTLLYGVYEEHLYNFFISAVYWGIYMGLAYPSSESLFADSILSSQRTDVYSKKYIVQILCYLVGYILNISLFFHFGNKWEQSVLQNVMYVGVGLHPLAFIPLAFLSESFSLKTRLRQKSAEPSKREVSKEESSKSAENAIGSFFHSMNSRQSVDNLPTQSRDPAQMLLSSREEGGPVCCGCSPQKEEFAVVEAAIIAANLTSRAIPDVSTRPRSHTAPVLTTAPECSICGLQVLELVRNLETKNNSFFSSNTRVFSANLSKSIDNIIKESTPPQEPNQDTHDAQPPEVAAAASDSIFTDADTRGPVEEREFRDKLLLKAEGDFENTSCAGSFCSSCDCTEADTDNSPQSEVPAQTQLKDHERLLLLNTANSDLVTGRIKRHGKNADAVGKFQKHCIHVNGCERGLKKAHTDLESYMKYIQTKRKTIESAWDEAADALDSVTAKPCKRRQWSTVDETVRDLERGQSCGFFEKCRSSYLPLLHNHNIVPFLVVSADFIQAVGSGMTVRFMGLFFVNDYNVPPIDLTVAFVIVTFLAAVIAQVINRLSVIFPRIPLIFGVRFVGTSMLAALALVAMFDDKKDSVHVRWALLAVFITRQAFMNCSMGLSRSVIMDFVSPAARTKWSAMESFASFTWAGSAVVGGFIADAYGYSATFLATAALHFLACSMLIPAAMAARRVESIVLEVNQLNIIKKETESMTKRYNRISRAAPSVST